MIRRWISASSSVSCAAYHTLWSCHGYLSHAWGRTQALEALVSVPAGQDPGLKELQLESDFGIRMDLWRVEPGMEWKRTVVKMGGKLVPGNA